MLAKKRVGDELWLFEPPKGAIELRGVALVREGRIISTLPPFTEGFLLGSVPVHDAPPTLYTRWGDWLPWVLLAASVVAVAAGIFRRARRRRN